MENLKKSSIIVNLKAEPQIIYERVKGNLDRPILRSANPSLEKIKQLLDERRPFYDKCDFAIDVSTLNPQEAAAEILNRMDDRLARPFCGLRSAVAPFQKGVVAEG
jgi:shikimate kinase